MPERTLTIHDLIATRAVGDPQVSPDGRFVAYTVSVADFESNKIHSSIWLARLADGTTRRLTWAGQNDRFPRWAPNSRTIAFIGQRNESDRIFLIDLDGGEARPLLAGDSPCGAPMADLFLGGVSWSPDGRRVAFAAQERVSEERKNREARGIVVLDRNDGDGYGRLERVQIWIADVATGQASQLTTGDYHNGDPQWSPDDQWIAFVSNRSGTEEAITPSPLTYDVWLVSVADGILRPVTTEPGPDTKPRWSPDGRRLAYATVDHLGTHNDVARLAVYDLATGATHLVAPAFPGSVDRLPTRCWSADGRSIRFVSNVGTEAHIFEASVETGDVRQVTSGPLVVDFPSYAANGVVTALVSTVDRPPEVWAAPGSTQPFQPITRSNPELDDVRAATVDVVRWKAPDGLEIEGVVTRPIAIPGGAAPAFQGKDGDKPPLMLIPHGGPHSRTAIGYGAESQYWAGLGFLVFQPNFRGSTGYGQAFIDADRGDFGGRDWDDVVAGVDELIRRGEIDAQRMVINGGSYGGFLSTWAVTHTDRFKVAVVRAPVTNLWTFFGTTDLPTWIEWEFYGHPWDGENLKLLLERSPIFHVANAKTPMLIVHGDEDRRVHLEQGLEFHTALRHLGVPTEMVVYKGNGHGVFGPPLHRQDFLTRATEWVRTYL